MKIAGGLSSEEAALACGVSGPVGVRWFRERVIDLATGESLGADKGQGCAEVVALEVVEGRLLLGLAGPDRG